MTFNANALTNFMKENVIQQDLVNNIIHLDNKQISVMLTDHTAIMPSAPLCYAHLQVVKPYNNCRAQGNVRSGQGLARMAKEFY